MRFRIFVFYLATFVNSRIFIATAKPVDCTACHSEQATRARASVHGKVSCRECHGGDAGYESDPQAAKSAGKFDHGASFRGHIERTQVPNLCGDCHSDVAKMNPYGLRTDQLAAYWTSVHGKALKEQGETRVAVCTDCHGAHEIQKPSEPTSKTNPLNVPDTCGRCHADAKLMADFKLPAEIVGEYRSSVHGRLLLEQHDRGAPTCATCHGNHAATPPGFATVGAVCGKCHQQAAENFGKSIHAEQETFHGCVECHGGGPDAHFHKIERITVPASTLIERFADIFSKDAMPSAEMVAQMLHPAPRQIIQHAMGNCTQCHESAETDASLQKFSKLLDELAGAERKYVDSAHELDRLARGTLLVDNQRFHFEEATTHLIALGPAQHTLNNEIVAKKVSELNAVCDDVNVQLAQLEKGLQERQRALIPIWAFAVVFAVLLYVKYKKLRAEYVAK